MKTSDTSHPSVPMHLNDMAHLLVHQTTHLYDAEHRLAHLLYDVAANVHTPVIVDAIHRCRRETQTGINRLERVFKELGVTPRRANCTTVREAVTNCEQLFVTGGNQQVKEVALLAAIQRIQNYVIAFYRTLYAIARRLSFHRTATLFRTSLDVEVDGDLRLAAFIRQRAPEDYNHN